MAIKSLTITEEAYNALKSMKHGDESFSKAILRISKSRTPSADRFFGILKDIDLKELKSKIKARRSDIEKEFRRHHDSA
ncbi:antitoxin VapB family protein [Candidatus Woesearchaeota archaeon]|nr:antitoxin VapB family protein [Candidatus Woesearchaeota archaeon]